MAQTCTLQGATRCRTPIFYRTTGTSKPRPWKVWPKGIVNDIAIVNATSVDIANAIHI